jgi:hypothetical protein
MKTYRVKSLEDVAKMFDPRLIWMPEQDWLKATGICITYHNRWWVCHPETQAVLFVHVGLKPSRTASLKEASPQCNSEQATAIHLQQKLYSWAATRFVPLVLQPINVRDYE